MLKIPVAKPYIDQSDLKGVKNVLTSGQLSLGPKYIEFENKFAQFIGTRYACAVSSGTAGLHLTMKVLGISKGDEVITTPFSFIASSNCILYEGAKPVFVDIDPITYNLNPKLIEKSITKKTKAILVVHIFGQSADMKQITRIASKYNLKIIEDACESIGAYYNKKMTGTFGDIGVFAFYPNKQMTTGEGGMIVSNSSTLIELCRSMRNQGRPKSDNWLVHERLGYNYRMNEMSASLGITQLKKIKWMISKRKEITSWYNKFLSNQPGIITPATGRNRNHTWFVYVIRLENYSRDKLMSQLAKLGISTKPYLPVIHLQPFMRKMFHHHPGQFPIAETVTSQTIALPLYIGLSKKQIKYICDTIINLIN